jgi:phosphoenolpyruvate-protein kinase (PTS system EI component)
MHWAAILALAFDLSTVKTEPKLEKRSELALQYANTALDSAKTAYQEGRFEKTQAHLAEVKAAVTLAHDSLLATGKNPRKSSGMFKNAEKATRALLRRLTGFKDSMSVVDHPVLEPVLENVKDVHDQLLTGIMTGK